MSSKKLNPFKDFQSDQIQRSSRKIFTAHYANALNLTPVTGTSNGFIFQIINSLMESWGVHLTWFDCNGVKLAFFLIRFIVDNANERQPLFVALFVEFLFGYLIFIISETDNC